MLVAALAEAKAWIDRAERPVIFFGVELYRFGLQDAVRQLVETSGIPAAVTLLDKGAIEEDSPLFLGVYAGALGREDVRRYVEDSDCLIMLGTLLTDINLGIATAGVETRAVHHSTRDRLAIRLHTYENVRVGASFINGLHDCGIGRRESRDFPHADVPQPVAVSAEERDEPITVEHVFPITLLSDRRNDRDCRSRGMHCLRRSTCRCRSPPGILSPAFYASPGFAGARGDRGAMLAAEGPSTDAGGDGAFNDGHGAFDLREFGLDPIVICSTTMGIHQRLIMRRWIQRYSGMEFRRRVCRR